MKWSYKNLRNCEGGFALPEGTSKPINPFVEYFDVSLLLRNELLARGYKQYKQLAHDNGIPPTFTTKVFIHAFVYCHSTKMITISHGCSLAKCMISWFHRLNRLKKHRPGPLE